MNRERKDPGKQGGLVGRRKRGYVVRMTHEYESPSSGGDSNDVFYTKDE